MTTPVTEITPSEMFQSLTGFDEIAIAKTFGRPVTAIAKTEPTTYVRALVFVHHRRTVGVKDHEARAHVLNMTLGQVETYFADEPTPSGRVCETCGQHAPHLDVAEGDDEDEDDALTGEAAPSTP